MKILYISALQPNQQQAAGRLDYQIINHLSAKGIVDEFVIDSDKNHNLCEHGFVDKFYYYKINNFSRIIQYIKYLYLPCMFAFRKNLKIQSGLRRVLLNQYDYVFCSMSQVSIFYPLISSKCKRFFLITHDVLAQSFQRKFENERNPILKLFYFFELKKCMKWEPRIYNNFNVVFTVSMKDKKLLENMGVTTQVKSLQAAFHNYAYSNKTDEVFRICYFGAFDRNENIDAVKVYLATIHEEIKKRTPSYVFVIIGKDADIHFKNDEHTKVYGFQEYPELILNSCNISVLPIRLGAGVKVKVLELLSLGIPCICSTVASEGIDPVYGLETYSDIDECLKMILEWSKRDFLVEKDRVRESFYGIYNSKNTLDVIDEIVSR